MSTYLDHAASTPMRDEARQAWLRASHDYANTASVHRAGQRSRRVLEDAREQLASVLGCEPIEVVFTSGGTEAINLAIRGLWEARRSGADAIVLPAGEHSATAEPVVELMRNAGARIRAVPVDTFGRIQLDDFEAAIAGAALGTALVAHNELGTINAADKLAAVAAQAQVPLHLDAVAAFGHLEVNFRSWRAQAPAGAGLVALSVSAHKIGGPAGIGALVVARSAAIRPILFGAGGQRGLRPGTADIAAAAAFAAAATAVSHALAAEGARLQVLRNRVLTGIQERVPGVVLLGDPVHRLPGNLHLHIPDALGESVLFLLDQHDIAVSTGAACQAGVTEPSHAAAAVGLTDLQARQVIRITLGHTSTDADVDALLAVIAEVVQRARASASRRS